MREIERYETRDMRPVISESYLRFKWTSNDETQVDSVIPSNVHNNMDRLLIRLEEPNSF